MTKFSNEEEFRKFMAFNIVDSELQEGNYNKLQIQELVTELQECRQKISSSVSENIFRTYIGECDKNTDSAALGYMEMIAGQLKKRQKGILIDTGIENVEFTKAILKIEQIIEKIKNNQ